ETRARPRWSEGTAARPGALLSPALAAELPGARACVNVRPPLFCSGPRFGLVLMKPVLFSVPPLTLAKEATTFLLVVGVPLLTWAEPLSWLLTSSLAAAGMVLAARMVLNRNRPALAAPPTCWGVIARLYTEPPSEATGVPPVPEATVLLASVLLRRVKVPL